MKSEPNTLKLFNILYLTDVRKRSGRRGGGQYNIQNTKWQETFTPNFTKYLKIFDVRNRTE